MTVRVALLGRGMAGTIFHAPLLRAAPAKEPADARRGLEILERARNDRTGD